MDYSYIAINLFSIIILLAIIGGLGIRRGRSNLQDRKAFLCMLVHCATMLALDSFIYVVLGFHTAPAQTAALVLNCLFYFLNPWMQLFYLNYCLIKLNYSAKESAKHFIVAAVPVVLNAVFSILNLFYPVYFSFDNGSYTRANLFFMSILLSYSILVYTILLVLKKFFQERAHPSAIKPLKSLLAFPIPPLIGGLLQITTHKIPVVWPSTVISMLIVFIYIQNNQIITDDLTGLLNRHYFMSCMKSEISKLRDGSGLYLILMDIDKFKSINDTFGHLEGDNALLQMAGMIQSSFEKRDFVGRYGGDEFMVLAKRQTEAALKASLANLHQAVDHFNKTPASPYSLSISFGYCRWEDAGGSVDRFISTADQEMYKQKVLRR